MKLFPRFALFALFVFDDIVDRVIARAVRRSDGGYSRHWNGQTLVAPILQAVLLGCLLFNARPAAAVLTEVRSYDGQGNNLDHPTWGAAGTPLVRRVPAEYPDVMGQEMKSGPNARQISNRLATQTVDMPAARGLSGFVWQWGQFLDHDLSLTTSSDTNGDATIHVSDPSDPLFPMVPMFRSDYMDGTGTSQQPRQHPNQITSFIDASNIYGSSEARVSLLRAFSDGRLLADDRQLMPHDESGAFMSGDIRANEQLALMSMHTLFMREHNRLAGLIDQQVSGLPVESSERDEMIFQAARKLVGAEMQAITYHEFLPAMLGDHTVSVDDVAYDPNVDPSISNEFAHALYRFGHSMLPSHLNLVSADGQMMERISLRDAFFKPSMMSESPERVDYLLKGLAMTPAQEIDTRVIDDVRNFLMLEGVPGGVDLAAMNIQRGRDHGLPSYNTLRESYGLAPITEFAQITTDSEILQGLEDLYASVDEIDAFIGALAEDHVAGTSVGPLVMAALTDQFTRLRDGDRLFYQNDIDVSALSEQIGLDLDQWRLSDIILANTGVTNIQANVFFVPEPSSLFMVILACSLCVRRGDLRRCRRLR